MKQGRLNWLDSARALLMLLGIPFHVAMAYSIATDWWVFSPEKSAVLSFFAATSNTFRMHSFFVVAGFFSFLILSRRGPKEFVRARLTRLGLPLLTALLLLGPLHALLMTWAGPMRIEGEPIARAFIIDGQITDRPGLHLVAHLWFLIDLLQFSLLTALLARFGLVRGIEALARRLQGIGPLGVAALLAAHVAYNIAWTGLGQLGIALPGYFWGGVSTHTLFMFAPYFIAGLVFCADRSLLFRALTWTKTSVGIALVLLLLGGVVMTLWHDGGTAWQKALRVVVRPLAAWSGFHLVVGACWRFLDIEHRLVKQLVDGAYSIYLLHHPIVVALAIPLCFVHLPPLLEFAALTAAGLGLSWGLHLVLGRFWLYRLFFNGDTAARPRRREAAPLASATPD
ncbi:acyltransferase family protein [Caldimonas brevitalea]|uniref:Glucans biosynthesis protein C n=1 Tax=Caldimonas brevitalea TaxID=413882 RepID=A0A0G3BJK5_9BURK|nr:acyltransferase family protein [Caldimonas brevitalea]AKJ28168.1 glucans biosynthesis protein C [Caldimonas brevitalea]